MIEQNSLPFKMDKEAVKSFSYAGKIVFEHPRRKGRSKL